MRKTNGIEKRVNRGKKNCFKKEQGFRRSGELALTLMLLTAISGCGSAGGSAGETQIGAAGEEGSASEVTRISAQYRDNGDGTATSTVAEYPTADTYNQTLMEGVNGFAYDMSEYLAADGENYFFSPYSLCSAMTLLDNAADGETKAQMEEVLGITDLQDWNMQLSLYMNQEQPKQAKLTSANSLWFDQQFVFSDRAYESYLPLVEFYYDAELYQADFEHDPDGTKARINQWVLENTGGMIENFKEEVDPDTALSLINAVYFYGEWSYPFAAEMTRKETFYGAGGNCIVDMMHGGDLWLSYYESDGIRGLSLPYGDGSKVMNFLLPSENAQGTVSELFGALSAEDKNQFLENLMNADTSYINLLQIPKFRMSETIDQLKEILADMGMRNVFDGTLAQLPGLGDIYVDSASHMAQLEVDELGSRAAAVTELECKDACAPIVEEAVDFVIDRPFLFLIQDQETGMILFMGQVTDFS